MALAAPSARATDEAAWLFNPDAVVEIDLGLSPEEIEALEDDPDEYQPGTFVLSVGGVPQGPPLGEVGIRLKGGASFRRLTGKAAFKIKFDKYVDDQTLFGLERLTLNNMVQDPSMIHETLAYEVFQALQLPASRTGYAFLRINGVVYGLYLNIETLDEISLPRWFDSTGHLYEADALATDVRPGEAGTFEVDVGDDEDLADLEALVEAANADDGHWSDAMADVADLRRLTRMWAVERYVGHWDGYAGRAAPGISPNNYYLHSDSAGLFSMIPWGTDQTWGIPLEFDEPAGGLLFNRCLADRGCSEQYVDALREVHALVPTLALGSHAAALAAQLAPHQALEDESRRGFTQAEIEADVDQSLDFIADRPRELGDWLNPQSGPRQPLPTGPGPTPRRRPIIGQTRLHGAVVLTRLRVFEPGQAEQAVSARIDGRRVGACAGLRRVARARVLTVRCRVEDRVRARLGSESLRLRVKVGFVAGDGAGTFVVRQLRVARRTG
jgi:hypothetical protein